MTKELLKIEGIRDSEEIAAYLHRIAERFEEGGELTLTAGDQTAEVHAPERAEFELQVEQSESLTGSNRETSIEMDIEWKEEQEKQRDLEIE